jgi:hypothetical protein
MQTTFPRDETSFVFGPDGLLLLAPLPGGRWLSFQDLEEAVETVSAEEVVARVETRLKLSQIGSARRLWAVRAKPHASRHAN